MSGYVLRTGRPVGALARAKRPSQAACPRCSLPQRGSALHLQKQLKVVCSSYAGSSHPNGSSPTSTSAPTGQRREAQLEALRRELRALEEERDGAVNTAESCAKTCVRLTDMSRLLEDLALEKVRAGDEAGAKTVLQEKNSLKEIIDKSNTKAQTNFALAGRLAGLIGEKHHELVALLGGGGEGPAPPGNATATASSSSSARSGAGSSGRAGAGAGAGPGSGSYGASWPEPPAPSTSYGTGYGSSSSSSASSPRSSGGGGGGVEGGHKLPWEKSLAEARQRVRQAEAEAQRMGRLAALSAEDSIAAARERLGQRRGGAAEGILEARGRLRAAAETSLASARERLRAQDAAVLEYCRRIVARYRRGEPVGEDELEFAFQQMERRLL